MTIKEEFTAHEIAQALAEKRAREKRVSAYKTGWAKRKLAKDPVAEHARLATYMREWRANNRTRSREISRAGAAKYNAANPASKRSQGKRHNDKVRAAIREFFGGKCVRCGFDDPRALQMDHIHGGGHQWRKAGNDSLGYRWRLVRDEPKKARKMFQLLCANCNVIKRDENYEYGRRARLAAVIAGR